MGLPVSHNLNAYRGDTWVQGFRFSRGGTAVNLTGATVKSEARDPDGNRTTLNTTVDAPTNGHINLSLPTNLAPGTYVYDIEVTIGGVVTTWVHGSLNVARDVTNEPA
jgi:hypothetical protein